jgi:UDP-glucose 4-epimerase
MRILLTGSSGRIGQAIYNRLSAEHDVIGLDRVACSTTRLVGEIDDLALLRRGFEGVDAVIHTAALHAPHVGLFPEPEFERINVIATQRIVDVARDMGVRRLVFTSTTALYGFASQSKTQAAWITEETQPLPRSIYHRSKLIAEGILATAAAPQLQVRILRMSRCFPEAAPLMAAYRLHRGVDARDVADAHAAALTNGGANLQIYIISGRTPFLHQDCELLSSDTQRVLKLRAPQLVDAFKTRGWPLPQRIDRVYDSALATKKLGWAPCYDFTEVIAQLDRASPDVLAATASENTLEE